MTKIIFITDKQVAMSDVRCAMDSYGRNKNVEKVAVDIRKGTADLWTALRGYFDPNETDYYGNVIDVGDTVIVDTHLPGWILEFFIRNRADFEFHVVTWNGNKMSSL